MISQVSSKRAIECVCVCGDGEKVQKYINLKGIEQTGAPVKV